MKRRARHEYPAGILRLLLVGGAVAALTACPLPFQFTPQSSNGEIAASNDPANPLVTAPAELSVIQTSSGVRLDATPATIASAMDVRITFVSQTPGASIHYTTDGSDPVPGSAGTERFRVDAPVELAGDGTSTTIKAIAIGPSMYPSLVTEKLVSIEYDTVAAPVFDPPAGDYSDDQSVSITTATAGATIYYTIADGTDGAPDPQPGQPGTLVYSGPITIGGTGTAKSISAIAVRDEMLPSSVVSATYTIGYSAAAPPALSLEPGIYHPDTLLEITSSTSGAIYYYTTDGSTPTTASPSTTGSLRLGDVIPMMQTRTITVIAGGSGLVPSAPVSASYSVGPLIRVTGTGDSIATDGVVTLREAITAANTNSPSGDAPAGINGTRMTITLDTIPALDSGSATITLGSPLPAINRDLVITAVPTRPVIVSGNGQHRVFEVTGGFVTFSNFEVRDGYHTTAAIDATIEGQAGGGGGAGMGAGLYINAPGGSVRVQSMTFRGNVAEGGRGGDAGPAEPNSTGPPLNGQPGAGPNGGAGGTSGSPTGGTGGFASGGGGGYQEANGGNGGQFGGGGGGGRADNGFDGGSGGFGGLHGGRGHSTYSGGAGGGGGGAGIGGAIAIVENGVVTIQDSRFIANEAIGGASGRDSFGGTYASARGEGKAGAIFVYGNAATVGVYTDLTGAGAALGGLVFDRTEFLSLGNTFENNTATDASSATDERDNPDTSVALFMF